MNKLNDNKLAISVVATLTAGIALIYVLIAYPRLIFAVFGTSVIFLICAYILTQNIIAFINIKNKSLNVQIKSGMDDISSQIEGMSSSQAQLGKATYLYTRQTAENVATLCGNYTESQEVLHKNLSVLANAQNKSTKLLIKYDQNNTTKLISTLKDIKNHLNETVSLGFEQIPQTNNDDVIAMLQSIVDYLKSQPANMDQSLSMQINNVAHELQNISMSIAKVQSVPMQPVMPVQQMSMQPIYQAAPVMQATAETPEISNAPDVSEIQENTDEINEMPVETAETVETTEQAGSELITEETTEEVAPDISEATPEEEAEFTPTFTVVGKSEPQEVDNESATKEEELAPEPESVSEPEPVPELVAEPEPVAVAPVSDDPNKQLSADEIAALFAASEPAPKKDELAPAPEPVEVAPVSDDPNKQLSADEIAALFAAAEPAPKKEEPAPAPEPVAVTPVSDDPNKQLSADEIAALFAAAEPAPKKEEPAPAPEPVAVTPVSDDPNKQLSADEIAALFASIG